MAFFGKKEVKPLQFASRSEAFAYMLAYQIEEKNVDPMEAATKANEFAELFANNMGLPSKIEPPVNGVDKYIQMAEKIGNYCDQHPKAVDMLVGAATFFAGIVAGKKIDAEPMAVSSVEPVDFNKLE